MNRTMKQSIQKRDDTPLHFAVRTQNLELALEILAKSEDIELKELMCKQNYSGETALYVAAEYGYVDFVKEMIKYYDIADASIKARNGSDAFHIAAKQGNLEVIKILMDALPELSMTFDQSNTTALHSAAAQGHTEVVKFLMEKNSNLVTVGKSNKKTALHSAARNEHLEVVKVLLSKETEIALMTDKKGQTALHMAVKGQSVEVVNELISSKPDLINMADNKGNTPLHMATRKGRTKIIRALLSHKEILDKKALNKSGESAFDTAEKTSNSEIASILREYGVQSAKTMKLKPAPAPTTAKELKQTVSDIKHEVHYQIEHTRQTRKQMKGIGKQINKMQLEGLNNAINSTTVVAVLIATVAFAAIFTVPGQYVDDPKEATQEKILGEANIAPKPQFTIFLISDSLALFISLAVVVVQTSIVVVEKKGKKQMMAIINKLMWLACVSISVAFLALSFIVVGEDQRWLAVAVTVIGTLILATTLGTMIYWVILNRIEASNLRSIRRSARSSKSQSFSQHYTLSDSENNDYKNLYAI
nr:PREDICTED: ankyrin repeat-containing protein At5g02620 [Daucus carota subsp. sativus]XP_017253238.1 PREDICTED: ankyrin repeat-containing protein At5g02620 [Daucus carota subsp. sativus]XP_017253239.1 PREDICTED: ankyrin repeat-containing protein At5g02620 [Daucus carota subsp. sativus]XP_017253240.1 PREDICTED: ankyrin repeat-containing protein At5g02620 [Daucus carota subsp. sativus]